MKPSARSTAAALLSPSALCCGLTNAGSGAARACEGAAVPPAAVVCAGAVLDGGWLVVGSALGALEAVVAGAGGAPAADTVFVCEPQAPNSAPTASAAVGASTGGRPFLIL